MLPDPVTLPTDIRVLAWAFIVFWIIWVNLPFLTPGRWSVLARRSPAAFGPRIGEWLLRWPLIPLAGWAGDRFLTNRPHSAYLQWDFWLLLLTMSAVLTLPGVVYFYFRKKNL